MSTFDRRIPPPAFAQTALLHYENADEFEQMRNAYLDEHLPGTPTEHYFINEMANAQWRLRRLRLSTDPTIDNQAAQAEAVRLAAGKTKALQFILRHESALRRQYERALKMFWECRSQRDKRREHEARVETQKVQKQTQSSPALVAFERRLAEFCSAPPPLNSQPPRHLPQAPRARRKTSQAHSSLTTEYGNRRGPPADTRRSETHLIVSTRLSEPRPSGSGHTSHSFQTFPSNGCPRSDPPTEDGCAPRRTTESIEGLQPLRAREQRGSSQPAFAFVFMEGFDAPLSDIG